MILKLVMPVVLGNLGGYAAWLLQFPGSVGLGFMVVGIVAGLVIALPEIRNSVKSLPLVAVALPLIVATAMVILPIAQTRVVDGFEFVVRPSTTDYFKHLYVITTLVDGEVPPVHPFFTAGKFSYYFGYYFVPSVVSKIVPVVQGQILYGYAVLTGILGWVVIASIVRVEIRKWWLRFGVMAGLVFGTSADIWPTLLDNHGAGGRLIELWAITHNLGLRIDNIFTSFLWTPQHFFAAVVTLAIWHGVWKKKFSWWSLGLAVWFVSASSVFVALALIWGLGVLVLMQKDSRKMLVKAGVLAGVLMVPMVVMLAGRAGIFSTYAPAGYPFGNIPLVNLLITWIVEYGLVLSLLPVWLFITRRQIGSWWILIIAGGVPIVGTWIIQSAGYNDLALRGTLPLQLVGIVGFGKIVQIQTRMRVRVLMVACLAVSIGISSLGFGYEFMARWKENLPTNPETSELLLKVRELTSDRRLMVQGRDEWVYLVPSMGYKPILTSALYDAGQYLDGPPGDAHYKYEVDENELFFATVKAQGRFEVTEEFNRRWREVRGFLTKYPADDLVVGHDLFLKEGINPWLKVYEKMDVGMTQLAGRYSLVDIGKIDDVLKSKNVVVNFEKGILAKMSGDKLELPEGVQVLVTCRDIESKWVRFELVAHYSVFNEMVDRGFCLGRMFYNPAVTPLEVVMGSNSFEQIWSYPIEIK